MPEHTIDERIQRAQVLIEALPYIKRFSGHILVIKVGGAAGVAADLDALLEDVVLLRFVGMRPVIVHGGGSEISAWQQRMGIETKFVNGLRVTDAPTMEIAKMVLTGKVGPDIVARIHTLGAGAIGLSGEDGPTLLVRPRSDSGGADLGFVGDVAQVNGEPLMAILDQGRIPVMASIGLGYDGQAYNVNADTVAAELAVTLHASKLILMTDVEGVRDADGALISQLDAGARPRAACQRCHPRRHDPEGRGGDPGNGRRMRHPHHRCARAARAAARAPHRAWCRHDAHRRRAVMTSHSASAPATIAERAKASLMDTYQRQPITLRSGNGVWVTAEDGREYLDLVAGIAVNVLGHNHPALHQAIAEQAGTLMHTSNLYYTAPQLELAELLIEFAFPSRVFFCNSGAEANEGAIKLARKWGKLHRDGAHVIVCAQGAFHGRTMGALAATANPRYRKQFEPLPKGFVHVPYDDLAALEQAIDSATCAVMLEPIEGESGVVPLAPGRLAAIRRLCDERNVLLILDEVQTGMGRTGRWWAYQHEDAAPDVMTVAKGLGGGVPIGAILASPRADVFEPGDHGSTFGGGPLACAAAVAVMRTVTREGLVEHAAEVGDYLAESVSALAESGAPIAGVRGRGLMLGIALTHDVARDVAAAALEEGLIVNAIGERTLRLVPPLIISRDEVDLAVQRLSTAFDSVAAAGGER